MAEFKVNDDKQREASITVVDRIVEVIQFRTKLSKAATNSESLRTTVPHEIVSALGLRSGEEIVWKMNPQAGTIMVMAPMRTGRETYYPQQSGALQSNMQKNEGDG